MPTIEGPTEPAPGLARARTSRRWLAALGLMALFAANSAQAYSRTLAAVDYAELPGGQVVVTLTLSGPAPQPGTFTVNRPARLVLDLPGTKLAVDRHFQKIDSGNVRSLALAQGAQRTRVVVDLTKLVPYKVSVRGRQLRLRLGTGESGNGAPSPGAASAAPPGGAAAIRNIDFRRIPDGAGRVAVTVGELPAPVDISRESGRMVARFPGARLPAALVKRLDVTDFATPVKYVDAVNAGGGAQLTVTPIAGADFTQVAYQADGEFIVELRPKKRTAVQKKRAAPEYTGRHISLSFQNVDIRALLQIVADVGHINMVVSRSVSGSMALQLRDVPWDQALAIILRSAGLGSSRRGNVITVAPLAEIAAREQAELAAEQATANLAPLTSEIIQANYARAGDLVNLLQSGKTGLLSPRGRVSVDQRTNTLLIRDTRTKLAEIRRVIERLDIPVRQVLIEARIVVANREFARTLGVSATANDTGSIKGLKNENFVTNSGFSINLPTANPAGSLTTGILGNTFNLNLALSALETENRGEVISSPRVITANAKEAKIEQGVEIPYLQAASSGAATVRFKDAVLSLTVTPQITPDQRVIMDLFVTQDAQGDSVAVQGGGSVPSINTRSLTTQVLVDNGDTVVLGGIYEQTNRDRATRVPILGKIPLLGALFRNTDKQRNKRELLIFVTPRILKQGLAIK